MSQKNFDTDSGIMSVAPYDTYVQEFTLLVACVSCCFESTHLHPSTKAAKPEWHQIFLRGIGCNWLVAVAVWVRVIAFIMPSHD